MPSESGSVKEQFDNEARALKQIIYEFIDSGQIIMAAQLAEQYALVNPSDPELEDIKRVLFPAESYNNSIPEELSILRNVETIFILTAILTKRTGYIDSVLRKIRLMEEKWGYSPILLTTGHNLEHRKALMWLQTASAEQTALGTGAIGARTRVFNVYEYYQNSYAPGLENKAVYEQDILESNTAAKDEEATGTTTTSATNSKTNNDAKDEKKADQATTRRYYTGSLGSLRVERSFDDNGNKLKDIFYDDWGYLNCIREYSPICEDIFDEEYYTTDGRLCITRKSRITDEGKSAVESSGSHEPVQKITLYDTKGNVRAEVGNDAELAAIFLEDIMNRSQIKFFMLVCEAGLMAEAVTIAAQKRRVEVRGNDGQTNILENEKATGTHKGVAAAITIHSIFLGDAYNLGSAPQKYYKYLCENHEKFDCIITMTNAAREDFLRIYGASSNETNSNDSSPKDSRSNDTSTKDKLFVIPHPYPYEINRADWNTRDKKLAVIVARLDPNKQLDYAIGVFSMVASVLSDVRLEIYGRGHPEDEEYLREQIEKLGMQKNIFLMGHTDQPLFVFNKGILSMMTSRAEGYGLTVMESICNGCPVFAGDIKYGPSEIIDDGKTGFLVPRLEDKGYPDPEVFAQKMISYFSDENMQRRMSENCYEAAGKFGADNFLGKWYKMVEKLYGAG